MLHICLALLAFICGIPLGSHCDDRLLVTDWSDCSATCGFGKQTRLLYNRREGESSDEIPVVETKRCFISVCPSYLGRPRIHFSGYFVADTPTVNNFRPSFDPKNFCPNCDKKSLQMNNFRSGFRRHGPKTKKYETRLYSWNPMGGGHFYFINTFVTSACWENERDCVLKDPLVGRKVENPNQGRIVDLDTDWQTASTVYGLSIHIPGMITSLMKTSEVANIMQKPSHNITNSIRNAMFKSKLINITWEDPYYENKFKGAEELSITFAVDKYDKMTKMGRVTGTIGLTSSEDPQGFYGGRAMKTFDITWTKIAEVPFYFNYRQKILTVDFSNWLFAAGDSSVLKDFTLVLKSSSVHDRYEFAEARGFRVQDHHFIPLSRVGYFDFLFKSKNWYVKRGGIVDVDLSHVSSFIFDLLRDNQVGIICKSLLRGNRRKRRNFRSKVFVLEDKYGINMKPFEYFAKRLSNKESWKFPVLVTSFGRPLDGAKIEVKVLKQSEYFSESIHNKKTNCNPFISTPLDVLHFSPPRFTDENGLVEMRIDVVKDPGNPRKGGLDGQVYPYGLILSYNPRNGDRIHRIGEGGMFNHALDEKRMRRRALRQCGLDLVYSAINTAIKVYSSLPSSVMRKKCPTWKDDVKYIFQFYANIAPVMTYRDIINLKDVNEVRSKLKLIKMSMFGYDFDHPNFMPITRDLSPDKTEIVRRWLECEISGEARKSVKERLQSASQHACDVIHESPEEAKKHLHELLKLAMWVEFYTIPPYLTAYFSIKSEANPEVKKVLQSIATEEMLHLSMASNILNSLEGKSDITDLFWHPTYPSHFPSKNLIQVLPRLQLRLEKFSRNLMENLFSKIEKPAPCGVLSVIHSVALLWRELPKQQAVGEQCSEDDARGRSWNEDLNLDNPYLNAENFNKSDPDFLLQLSKFSSKNLALLEEAEIDTIGSFYAYVMMHLIRTETCLKMKDPSSTIFTGNPEKQLNSAVWYPTKGTTKGVLYPVTNLKTALEALLDISYEGEGGNPCSPFISNSRETLGNSPMSIKAESHYIKFQELAKGRKIVPLLETPPPWSEISCLKRDNHCCSCFSSNGSVSYSSSSNCVQFCFSGESLAVDESIGVWPLTELPLNETLKLETSKISKETIENSNNFDKIYTTLMKCLNISFNGRPDKMATCMGNMYELQNAGKKLVETPIFAGEKDSSLYHPLPRWKYVEDGYKDEGLIVDDYFPEKNEKKIRFC